MPIKVKQKHGGAINRIQKGDTTNGGRPPKLATTIIKALKEQGVARVDRTEVDELICRLQNLSRKELVKLANADDTPMVVALIARGMAGAKGHEFLVRDLWDRAHGKAKQAMDVTSGGKRIIRFIDAPHGGGGSDT
jgi:hypothetical protein